MHASCKRDSMQPLRPGTKITVTCDDIKNGEGGNPTRCPVALAVRRIIPRDFYPYVVSDWIEIVGRGEKTLQRFDLPCEVGEWIRQFDEMCDYNSCETNEDFAAFWGEYGDGEAYGISPVEPFGFAIPD